MTILINPSSGETNHRYSPLEVFEFPFLLNPWLLPFATTAQICVQNFEDHKSTYTNYTMAFDIVDEHGPCQTECVEVFIFDEGFSLIPYSDLEQTPIVHVSSTPATNAPNSIACLAFTMPRSRTNSLYSSVRSFPRHSAHSFEQAFDRLFPHVDDLSTDQFARPPGYGVSHTSST